MTSNLNNFCEFNCEFKIIFVNLILRIRSNSLDRYNEALMIELKNFPNHKLCALKIKNNSLIFVNTQTNNDAYVTVHRFFI